MNEFFVLDSTSACRPRAHNLIDLLDVVSGAFRSCPERGEGPGHSGRPFDLNKFTSQFVQCEWTKVD